VKAFDKQTLKYTLLLPDKMPRKAAEINTTGKGGK
jgi:hypothetical protein